MSIPSSQPDAPEVDIETFAGLHAKGVAIVDVREDDEYVDAHIPGVVHIPLGELGQRLQELPAERPLYVVCAVGSRSLMAATALKNQAGIDAVSVAGGTNAWIATGHPVETGV